MKTRLQGMNSTLDITEKISEPENIVIDIIQNEIHIYYTQKTNEKQEQSITELWDNYRQINLCPIPVPKGLGGHKNIKK